jgi:hypothetical protein
MNVLLHGAEIKLYINNVLYKEVQSITLNIDYGETPLYGIDSVYPQEIYTNKVQVSGNIQGLRMKNSGGIQSYSLRPSFTGQSSSPYVSILIKSRSTGEVIVEIPKAKVNRESHQVGARGVYKLNFDFIGIQPLMALDRSE